MDPTNYPAQLLLIHFMLIEFAIGYIALGRYGRRWGYRERVCITCKSRTPEPCPFCIPTSPLSIMEVLGFRFVWAVICQARSRLTISIGMRRVADALPDEYREYAKWPMDFVNEQLATGDLYHLPAPQRRETEP